MTTGRYRFISMLFATTTVAACGGTSERDVPVCRNAWREIRIPDEFRDFRAISANWLDGRLVLLRAESPAATPEAPKGLVYEPPARFTTISEAGAPPFIAFVAAIAVGDDIVVFSDRGHSAGRYDTARDAWASVPPLAPDFVRMTALVPLPEKGALVGADFSTDDAARTAYFLYEAADDAWREVASPSVEPLNGWVGVWTGEDAVVAGVTDQQTWLGARYSEPTDTWTALSAPGGGSEALWFPVAWTGTEVLASSLSGADTGGLAKYDPARDSWELADTSGIPEGSLEAVLPIDRRAIVWNTVSSEDSSELRLESALYDAATDRWTDITTSCGPEARHGPLLAWTEAGVVAWGGSCLGQASDDCPERAWYLPAEALFGEVPEDPEDCSCQPPLGED